MSPKAAGLAAKWGHHKPYVYVEGIPVWKKSGHRVVPTLDYLETGNIVLLDLRSAKKTATGHLPRAYSITVDELEDAEEILPAALGAPIYVYAESDKEIASALEILKDELGYKDVTGVYDALKIWEKAGKKLVKEQAPVATEENPIKWKKKLGSGEISIKDFTQSLNSDLIFVVDARTPAEYESGHFPGSVSIPLEQMKGRLNEIPKDKFIVVHCKTGGRGEIGYHLLKNEGYAVKFLNAECECQLSGEYKIW